ncbi:uncharacterized protein DMAD_00209 [Drosophila madeirensis]|uniref:Uncharacterized protein n=1 Tax=Drosophila madeirensis TaxID=30013 RepID=A0AAU9FXJ6_DROMD
MLTESDDRGPLGARNTGGGVNCEDTAFRPSALMPVRVTLSEVTPNGGIHQNLRWIIVSQRIRRAMYHE